MMFSILLLFIAITSLSNTAYGDKLQFTIKMCWLPRSLEMDRMDGQVELNIRIVTCKPNEACVPSTEVEKWPGVGICQAKDSTVINPPLIPEIAFITEYCLPEGAERDSIGKPEILIKIVNCKPNEVCAALPNLAPGFGKCQQKPDNNLEEFKKMIARRYSTYIISELCKITPLRNLLGEKCPFIEQGVIPKKISDKDLTIVTSLIKKMAKYDRNA